MRTKCECRRCVNRDAEQKQFANNSCVPVQRMKIKLIEDCKQLMPAGFTFQQDGAPAHTPRVTQEWLHVPVLRSLRRTVGHQIPKISTPLAYHVWGTMLERYHKLQPKPNTIAELKAALQLIWDDMSQEPINKAVKDFTKRLKACAQVNGGHFEHLM